ncbi:hypothetical protein [Bradyrhizobium sp. McL0615]|uniref:hypothetical protein n=1 Tax=Bradyrhizobium sp. McL0615 TaxID=3415673 RepID=UPI003CEE0DCC
MSGWDAVFGTKEERAERDRRLMAKPWVRKALVEDIWENARLEGRLLPRRRAKKTIPIPDNVKPDTMLRLAVAAQVAFPDGSMSVGALRREGIAGRLRVYRIAGKDYTTLHAIELMREASASCHVQQSPPVSSSGQPVATEPQSSSSSTEARKLALAAARATLMGPSEPSEPISKRSTTPPAQSATVIQIKSR